MNPKKIKSLILLLILGAIAYSFPKFSNEFGFSKTSQENLSVNNNSIQTGKVLRVIDGDTISVELGGKETKVRVIGINSPEIVDPRKTVECFGKEASEKAKSILDEQVVTLESDPTQSNIDKYGRLLRYIYLPDGSDFGLKMIEEGFAYEYTYDTPYKNRSKYKETQKNANYMQLGLWNKEKCL